MHSAHLLSHCELTSDDTLFDKWLTLSRLWPRIRAGQFYSGKQGKNCFLCFEILFFTEFLFSIPVKKPSLLIYLSLILFCIIQNVSTLTDWLRFFVLNTTTKWSHVATEYTAKSDPRMPRITWYKIRAPFVYTALQEQDKVCFTLLRVML